MSGEDLNPKDSNMKKLPFEIDEVGVVTGDADACRDWIHTLPLPEEQKTRCEDGCRGADIFQVGRATHEFEIERCDECGRFEDDLAAIRWVRWELAKARHAVPFSTFYNVRISIGTAPDEAYDLLCAALKKIQDENFVSVDWESSTFSVNDGEEKETIELFPRPGSTREIMPTPTLGQLRRSIDEHENSLALPASLRATLAELEQQVFDLVFHPDPSARTSSTAKIAERLARSEASVSRDKTNIGAKAMEMLAESHNVEGENPRFCTETPGSILLEVDEDDIRNFVEARKERDKHAPDTDMYENWIGTVDEAAYDLACGIQDTWESKRK